MRYINWLLVACLFLFALLGRYNAVAVGFGSTETRHPIAYRLDRLTGQMWLIRGLDAYKVKDSPLAAPADGEKSW